MCARSEVGKQRVSDRVNEHGQPIGPPVDGWKGCEYPPRTPMAGAHCVVEPFNYDRHLHELFDAHQAKRDDRNWTYLYYGPFDTVEQFSAWVEVTCLGDDPFFHTIIDNGSGKAVGLASYMRIKPPEGVIEVGHITYSPLLQRTVAATEAMYLMMRRVFDELGYRRYEWKTDALNERSRTAAERLGFAFEGIFRQATLYKGRNRDTAWYSILDSEWPAQKAAFEAWLAPDNFGDDGRPLRSLAACRKQSR